MSDVYGQAVTLDSQNSVNTNTGFGSTSSWTHTCTGTNMVLIVSITVDNGIFGNDITTITYNGTPFTKLLDQGSGTIDAELWYLINPDTLAGYNVTVTSNNSNTAFHATSVSFTNAHQTPAILFAPTNTGSGTSTSGANITNGAVNANQMVIDNLAFSQSGFSAVSSTLDLQALAKLEFSSIWGGCQTKQGSGGTILSQYNWGVDFTAGAWAIVTTVLNPVVIGPPAGDAPCVAIPITVGCSGAKLIGNNTGLTNSGVAAPSCGNYSGGDQWFSLVVPASGTIKIETYPLGLTDVAMAVYSTSTTCAGVLTELDCNADSGSADMAVFTLTSQTPGDSLFIRVWDENNDQTSTYEIDASDQTQNYCVTGDAIDLGSGCAQLTNTSTLSQTGSIWDADSRLDFTIDFSYDFVINLGSNDAGADGICFVIQNDPAGLQAFGVAGGAIGAGGINNSLIIETDTFINVEDNDDGISANEPAFCNVAATVDHMDLWLNGNVNPAGTPDAFCNNAGARVIPTAIALPNVEDGLDKTLRISYVSGTQTITATLLNSVATITLGTLSYSPIDPLVLFGTNSPYFGFTASTGSQTNVQTACLDGVFLVPLPIDLLSFNANVINEKSVRLDWQTASETNNDFFTIECSVDGKNWEEVIKINGAENSSSLLDYTTIDNSPYFNISYYRLKQTDFDGNYSYSEIRSVNIKNTATTIYPNPTKDQITIEGIQSELEQIRIFNTIGQDVTSCIIMIERNETKLIVDLSSLSVGIYYVKTVSSVKKVIKR
ncbi:MAG: hypothetical protein ACJA0U_002773 [Salibacteraceae bacterium]